MRKKLTNELAGERAAGILRGRRCVGKQRLRFPETQCDAG